LTFHLKVLIEKENFPKVKVKKRGRGFDLKNKEEAHGTICP
jgi:hypothetical protein